jgi:hypothetical protein
MYFFLVAYSILGAGIKFIDDAFDEKIFSKKFAFVISPILGILWAYTMIINPVSATILLAILCGIFLKGKIDNYAHLIGFLIIISILLIVNIQLMILPLLFLSAAALLDEVGNDAIDRYKKHLRKNNKLHQFVYKFFDHRWLMKISVLFLALFGIIPLFFFIAMILFDYSYLTIRCFSEYKQGKSESWRYLKTYRFKDFISSIVTYPTAKTE